MGSLSIPIPDHLLSRRGWDLLRSLANLVLKREDLPDQVRETARRVASNPIFPRLSFVYYGIGGEFSFADPDTFSWDLVADGCIRMVMPVTYAA